MNDFAGPIIQAFMQGQQMKRQTQQDVIAAQEREKEAKRYADSLKRMEQQDKLQVSLGRLQIEDILRKRVGSGDLKIPIGDMQAPGGMQAPQMGPIAQQLMGPSAVQEMPLQEMPGQTQTMQLGQEFALPETNRVQKPIINIPGYGDFDLSQFRGEEETMRRNLMLARQAMGLEGEKTKINEAIKSGFRIAEQAPKDIAAMNRVLTQVGGTAANLDKTLEQRETSDLRNYDLRVKQYEMQTKQNDARNAILLARANKAANGSDTQNFIANEVLNRIKTGAVVMEDLKTYKPETRALIFNAATDQGIPIYSKVQRDSKNIFFGLGDILDTAKELETAYKGKFAYDLPFSNVRGVKGRLSSKAETVARNIREMKNAISDPDMLRVLSGFAQSPLEGGSAKENAVRTSDLTKAIRKKFDFTYPKDQFTPEQRLALAEETGLLKLFEEKK